MRHAENKILHTYVNVIPKIIHTKTSEIFGFNIVFLPYNQIISSYIEVGTLCIAHT